MSTERKTVQMNEQDTVARAIKRNLSPKKAAMLLRRGVHCLATRGVEATGREIAFRANLALGRDAWQHRADIPLRRELHSQRRAVFAHMPLISVVVPLYNTKITYLADLVECVLKQSYQKFELVLVNASSYDHPEVGEFCAKLHDARVRCVRLAKNGGIASNTNMGFSEARGEYIALLDHDDVLPKNALFEMAKAINDTGAELLYSDEIVLGADLKTLREYHFKPDYSPDTLCGCNYITHFLVFRRKLLERAGGGERKDYDGAQDFDLILRLSECANKVHHVPKVLYYWRSHALSTASDIAAKPYALEAGTKAIQAHLLRLGRNGTAESLEGGPGSYRVRYAIVDDPLVSVLIPNKDHVEDLKRCLDSLYTKAGYRNFEVLVLENNSTEQKTFDFYDTGLAGYAGCRVLTYHGDFNFSAINNFGAREAQGEQLLLLNNDIEFLSDGVLDELLMYSQRPDVGAVGAKLYYPDDTIQHAGVFIGLGGTAGHSHKGLPRETRGNMYRVSTVQNLSAVTGACLMVKKSLYDALGGLDEAKFAVSYNDVDFCLKLRARGLLNVFTPFVEAYHYESKSRGLDTLGKNAERYAKEKQSFMDTYAPMLREGGDPYYNPHLTLKYENYGYK